MYVEIHEDSEHRATMRAGCAVDLFTNSQPEVNRDHHGSTAPKTDAQPLMLQAQGIKSGARLEIVCKPAG